jgi:phage repressor protein C with HTH and peptisase S24 domain
VLPIGSISGIQTNEGSIEIDYIHIAPSCGRGTVVLDDADVTPVRIGKEVIKDIWKVSSPEVLKLFKASGDSMENTIEDGNILLVDTSRTDYHNGGIYVLTINNDWFVKRLRLKINGDLEIISDNPKYEPEVLRPNTDIEINVVGRVIKNLSRGL